MSQHTSSPPAAAEIFGTAAPGKIARRRTQHIATEKRLADALVSADFRDDVAVY